MDLVYSWALFHLVCDFEKLLQAPAISSVVLAHIVYFPGAFLCLCAVKSFVLLLILGNSTDLDVLYCYSLEKYQRIQVYEV